MCRIRPNNIPTIARCFVCCNARLAHVDMHPNSPRVLAYEIWTPLQQLDEIVDITPYLDDETQGHCGLRQPMSSHELRGRSAGTGSLSWRNAQLARRRIRRGVCGF